MSEQRQQQARDTELAELGQEVGTLVTWSPHTAHGHDTLQMVTTHCTWSPHTVQVSTLVAATSVLQSSVRRRAVFSSYLGRVVGLQPDTHPSIRALMERCQALVGTRSQ